MKQYMPKYRSVYFIISAVFCAPLLPTIVLAQAAPSRTAPESLLPPKNNSANEITLPETLTAQAPKGSEVTIVHVATVSVEGGPPAFAAAIDAATKGLAQRDVTVAELYAAAAQIEVAYARAGLVFTRATVPPQTITNGGVFRIIIVDGFIEAIDYSAVPAHVRNAVRKRAAKLVGVRGLTLTQIERRVLLAGAVPGVQLRSTLVRGTAVGATRLVLQADYRPVSLSLSADNGVGSAYQNLSLSGQLSLNSVLGLGELIYMQATTAPDVGTLFGSNPNRRILGAGAIIPLGSNGLTFNPEYTNVTTNPRTGAGTTSILGQYARFALRASYPLIKTRKQTLDFSGSFELISENEIARAFNLLLNKDRLRIAALGLNWAKSLDTRNSLSSELLFSHGIAGLGARTPNDALISGIQFSRQGSQPDFSKLSGSIRLDTQLGGGFALSNSFRGQISMTGALPAAAQVSLDGTDGLSSFDLGSLSVDSGVTGRSELSHPIAFRYTAKAILTPYVFGAAGFGHVSQPTALEQANLKVWSLGAGLRVLLSPAKSHIASYGSIEVSHGHSSNLNSDPTRINASISFRF